MSEKLKPCPFCGNSVEYMNIDKRLRELNKVHTNGPDHFIFRCESCRYSLQYDSRAQARHMINWNTRFTKPSEADND